MPLTPFADGPGNTASGVAVYNNDLYLEALANAKEPAFSTWKTVLWGGCGIPQQGAGGTLLMPGGPTQSATSSVLAVGAANSGGFAFYLDPADWTAGTRTTRLRLRAVCMTNTTAPAQNFVPGLYPIAGWGGGAGAFKTIATLGTVVTGSTVAFTTPGANAQVVQVSTEFTAPAADHYCFAVLIGGGMAANSTAVITLHLQMRQV